jgi:hypothetical protein
MFLQSKYYLVNIRRGIIYNTPFGSARTAKQRTENSDVIAVNGKMLLKATAFSHYFKEEGLPER